MTFRYILFLFFAVLVFVSCSRTNELAKYNFNNSKIVFKTHVAAEARQIQIETRESYNKKEGDSVLDAIASIGSDILSAENHERLTNAVHTEELCNYIADALADAMHSYLNTEEVASFDEDPQFIADVNLTDCKLIVAPNGVSVYVNADARLVDRNTGNIVWENWESRNVPIGETSSNSTNQEESKTVERVFNAIQLAALDEEELNRVVGVAVDDVGYLMAETLREDIVESRKN